MKISYNWLKEYINLKLPPDKLAGLLTMSGLSVNSLENKGADTILELEVTSNRADCLSYIGVAREAAAIAGGKIKIPAAKIAGRSAQGSGLRIKIKVEDKKLCPRYTGRIIRGVKVDESPAQIKSKLEAVNLRPVNNIVDITNFCLFETGEPMHAFDLDKIKGPISVRLATRGEKIKTIDGAERILNERDLVIADEKGPIAIAGVMGGVNTEVTHSTKNILLEAASFDPISVRRTSRRLGVSTESSYRFERRVDADNILRSSDRAAALIKSIADGAVGELIDIGTKNIRRGEVIFRFLKLDKVLGVEITPAKAKNILKALGFILKRSSGDSLRLGIPSFRSDIKNEIDVIEEVARVYGYNRIPETLPPLFNQPARSSRSMLVAKKTRDILAGLGCDEIITYGLLNKKQASLINSDGKGIVEITNPLSAEQEVMRPGLMAGMLATIGRNINRKNRDLKLFELGNIYLKGEGFNEKKNLAIGLTGGCDFFALKGIIEALLSELRIGLNIKDNISERFVKGSSAVIEAGNKTAGIMGEVKAALLNEFDIKDRVYFAEIDFESLENLTNLEKRFEELPKYPSVFRDISIIISNSAKNNDIITIIKNTAGNILKKVELVDRYSGKQIPEGKKGLTYRLEYQDPNKTLQEKEISAIHSDVIRALDDKFGAKLR